MALHQKFSSIVNSTLIFLQTHDWRGKHRFYLWLSNKFPHKVISHKIHHRRFFVPVGEWCFWLENGPENYYLDEFLPFCKVINQLNQPFVFFDLGADIGTVTSLVSINCSALTDVVAFEPNPKSYEILFENLTALGVTSHCVNAAVSNYTGMTTFHVNSERLNDHEGFIGTDKGGDTQVYSLDDWYQSQGGKICTDVIVLKIDVEGQEIQALQGAFNLIKNATLIVLLIEVHPDVLLRTNNTADDLFEAAEINREFLWKVPLFDDLVVDRRKSLFEQIPVGQYDIIGISQS